MKECTEKQAISRCWISKNLKIESQYIALHCNDRVSVPILKSKNLPLNEHTSPKKAALLLWSSKIPDLRLFHLP